jgi:nicotinamide mononucleotide adenylyltransferase
VEKLKAYHLTESEQDQAAIIFGRFNPPHFGHKAAWDIAASFPIWYVGTNQSTQGPKDPLPFEIKIEAMKTFMPELEDHLVAEQSWFTLASMVYKQHGAVTLHIVTDATDAKIFVPALQKQNGLEGPHGFYKFNDIVWAEAKRQSEASKVRQAVKDNNPQDFEKYSGVSANTEVAGHPYFNLVRHYMMPYMQAEMDKEKQKAEREKLKAEKEQQKAEKAAMKQTKTKGPAQELAEGNLKELSTELLGKYKKAAYADAKKADAEGDYARGNKRFKGINQATNKQFDNDLKKHGQKSVAESKAKRCMQCGMTNCSCKPGTCKCKPIAGWIPNKGFKQDVAEVKQRLDPKCWKGKHKEGTKIKGGVRVNNCVPNEGRASIGYVLEEIWQQRFNK